MPSKYDELLYQLLNPTEHARAWINFRHGQLTSWPRAQAIVEDVIKCSFTREHILTAPELAEIASAIMQPLRIYSYAAACSTVRAAWCRIQIDRFRPSAPDLTEIIQNRPRDEAQPEHT